MQGDDCCCGNDQCLADIDYRQSIASQNLPICTSFIYLFSLNFEYTIDSLTRIIPTYAILAKCYQICLFFGSCVS